MFSTPAKRSLKPTPTQQNTQFTTSSELPSLQDQQEPFAAFSQLPGSSRKRKGVNQSETQAQDQTTNMATPANVQSGDAPGSKDVQVDQPAQEPKAKKSRTNTPWTPTEEHRLKLMRDAGNSWSEIAKTFPQRTEGSVKKHYYKDMHYAEFGEDESAALLSAIKEYDSNKWKFIGQKVGKPAKACEQYAKEHFGGKS